MHQQPTTQLQHAASEREADKHEGLGQSMAPPAFQLSASPADAPVQRKEADGDWVPEVGAGGHVTLRAEEGDNWQTLMEFFKNSDLAPDVLANLRKAVTALNGDSSNEDIAASSSIDLTTTVGGPFAEMARLLNEEDFRGTNCSGTAIPLGKGDPVNIAASIDPSQEADTILMRDFESVPIGKAIAGRTIIRNATTKGADKENGQANRPLHYSTFLGIDQQGNIYVFTKNGTDEEWDIQILGQFHLPGDPEQVHSNYGAPMPIDEKLHNDSHPNYNPKK